ncbi:NB-ARC domain-containing protein [Psidium guajava]|nr:NB-ARC domain-containing protein [Psidium guajava]
MSNSLMFDARTDYALMDSRPSTRKRKLEELSNREASLPLVTTELVGKESEEAIKKICDYLVKNESNIIGIYGMGGVGKTAILMHVHNRVLENPAFSSSSVFWVSVPQKFSVYELQDEIANAVRLDSLSKDKDVKRRASILHRHLENMKSPILLLDGLWMHFEVEDVGIPIGKDGPKLALTTRSLDVCHKMLCQEHIKIEPLWRKEDYWSLFLKKLCSGDKLPSEVEKIAWSISDKCGGLPLGIIEIATRMRGVEEVHEWKGMLRKLEDSRVELDVFKRLKLSYVSLGDSQVQQCFLHLMLRLGEYFYETQATEEDMIESFIDEGLLSEIASRQELHDQGKTILHNLRKACLWEDPDEESRNVHPLLRDMALQIVTSTTHMVKARMGLKEIPEEEFWTDRLEKVFLQSNRIKEIPHGISPSCPKLTRLSLNDNVSLEAIHESFFRHLNGLKVLDLSHTRLEELPNSISHLESLEALLLRGCEKLRRIPCVGKLGSLRKLDLNGCAMIEELPEGMERLVELTYLDLRGTKIGTFPEGVLGKLVKLQYLATGIAWPGKLNCSVSDVDRFNSFVRFIERNSARLYKLTLTVSEEEDFFTDDDYVRGICERQIIIESCHSIAAWVDGGIGGDGRALLLPKNVKVLRVGGCGGVTSLREVGPLENLEELEIKGWENLERVGRVNFPHLKRLKITGCSKLKHLSEKERHWSYLPFLETISIEDCEGIEVIIGAVANKTFAKVCVGQDSFPRLTNLSLRNLPELTRMWDDDATESCRNLQFLNIRKCPKLKLKRIHVRLLLRSSPPSLRRICIDRQTWESLEQADPNASSSLKHLVDLYEEGSSFVHSLSLD